MITLVLIVILAFVVAMALRFVIEVEATRDPVADGEVEECAAVVIDAGEVIDLHPFAPRDVVAAARSFVDQAAEEGRLRVRLIHGRGRGVQRAGVRRMLNDHPRVSSFGDAPPELGGWGATLVDLHSDR